VADSPVVQETHVATGPNSLWPELAGLEVDRKADGLHADV
jgi:hypothetical protein